MPLKPGKKTSGMRIKNESSQRIRANMMSKTSLQPGLGGLAVLVWAVGDEQFVIQILSFMTYVNISYLN